MLARTVSVLVALCSLAATGCGPAVATDEGETSSGGALFDKNPYVDQGEVVENKRLGAAMKWVEGRQEKRDEARLENKKVSLREKKWIRQKSPAQTRIRQ